MKTTAVASLFANAPAALGAGSHGNLPTALEQEIRAIYRRSPLYGERFPLHPAALQWSCYRELPILTKQEILNRGHTAFFADYTIIERGLQEKKYEYEHTSGSTAQPMTVVMEEGWWNAQMRRAYLAHPQLAPYASRPYRKAVLAPIGCSSNLCPYEDHPFPHRYFDGTVYLNLSSDPFVFAEAEWDRIVLELQALQPEVLEGEPVYLSMLARAVQKRRVVVPSVRTIILTYGKASRQHSRRIAEAFPAVQVDLYGRRRAIFLSAMLLVIICGSLTITRSSSWCLGGRRCRIFFKSTSRRGIARPCRCCDISQGISCSAPPPAIEFLAVNGIYILMLLGRLFPQVILMRLYPRSSHAGTGV